jgi:hypothetical protein
MVGVWSRHILLDSFQLKSKIQNVNCRPVAFFSMPGPYCESFQRLDKRERSKSQWGRPFHNACNRYNLRYGEKKQSGQLYSRPRAPSPEHLTGKHGRTGYNQCRYRRFWLHETLNKFSEGSNFAASARWEQIGRQVFRLNYQDYCLVYRTDSDRLKTVL